MREHRERGEQRTFLRHVDANDSIQANVYHALTPSHDHLALKIYKTSILVFKDRDR